MGRISVLVPAMLGTALVSASISAVHMANAQSPADFFMEEARRTERQMVRPAAPIVRQLQAPVVSSAEFDRIVCTRVCDGARMVMAIRASGRDHDRYEQMCRAAGGENATQISVEKLAPIKTEQLLVAGPVMDGRATLASAPSCAGKSENLSVPIFADATLRRGDVVAFEDGLRVFTGSGRPPFKERDFKRLKDKEMAKDLRGLKVAGANVP